MTQIDTIKVGAGCRGNACDQFVNEHPQLLNVVGGAEPDPMRRERIMTYHDMNPDLAFDNWESLAATQKKEASTI